MNLFNIFLFFYISKVFSINELSTFLYVTAICRIFSFLFDGGFNQLILSEFHNSNFKKSLYKIFFLRNISSVVLIFLIYNFFYFSNYLNSFELNTFIILIIFYLNNENLNYFFSIMMSLNKNILILYTRIIFIAFSFGIFIVTLSFKSLLIYLSLSNFFPLIFIFFLSMKYITNEDSKITILNINEIFKIFIFYSSFLILSKGIGEINSNVDMIFMKNLRNEFFTSLYGLVIKINQITLIPHMLLGSMILPYLSSIKDSKIINKNLFELRFIHINAIFMFGILIFPFFFIFDKYMNQFNFELINIPFVLMLNIVLCFLISISFHFQQLLIVERKYFHLFIISFFSLFINLTLNFILIKNFHIYGAIITSIISHFSIFISYYNLLKYKSKFHISLLKDLKKYLNIIVFLIINIFVSLYFKNYFFIIFSISVSLFLISLFQILVRKPLSIR